MLRKVPGLQFCFDGLTIAHGLADGLAASCPEFIIRLLFHGKTAPQYKG